MIRSLLVFLLIIPFSHCKKVKEDLVERKVLNFITDGRWKVTELSKNSVDYTADFSGYQFDFKTNDQVDAIKNGSVQKTGTWFGDANTLTITSTFPSDATHPLPLLNGVWKLVDGGDNFAKATKTENGDFSTLTLEKI